jgi:hypothetical protein
MTTTIQKMNLALNAVHIRNGGYANDAIRIVEEKYGFTIEDVVDENGRNSARRFKIINEEKFAWFLLTAK